MNENVTDAEVREARGWIADVWGPGFAKRLSRVEVIKGISRHYDGGWAQFRKDGS